MSQTSGSAIKDTHLLRAAMLFMVLGLIGPGLFQLKPPQWFDESGDAGNLEMARPAMAPPKILPEDAPPPEKPVREPVVSPPPVTEPATPPSIIAAVPDSNVLPKTAPKTVPTTAQPTAQPTTQPTAQPEQPAIAARKARPEPTPEVAAKTETPPPQSRMTASLAPRTAKLPAIPDRSSTPLMVSRDFAKQIPESHVGLPVKRQKESFIAMTLPLILAANEEILQRRRAIERAVSRDDQATLKRWARLYRIEPEGLPLAEIERQLLLRADLVPVSLALAQAAMESGWGTSRFALQGNALFGQWAWQKDAGLKPARASNSQAVVRSFPNLFGSVRAYMHNLNTHPRYAAFRARRHLLRGRTQADLGYQLSNFLDGYAEIGEAYVAKLKTLIRSNEFGQYEAATLR